MNRTRLHEILETARPDDRASRVIDLAIVALIALNVLAVILESVELLHVRYGTLFLIFDVCSVWLFTIEYILRLWSCVEHPSKVYHHPIKGRLRYLISPAALVDLIAILPFYLSMFVTMDLRFIRVLRLFRLFKIGRYSRSMSILLNVLRKEADSFGSAFFILVIVLIMASSGIYLFEHRVQPEAFGSIPASIWWAVATLTTVGYGDVTPITTGGKVFGVFIMITGIGMVALPAGILASAFSEQLRQRRAAYQTLVDAALDDGIVTRAEQRALDEQREGLGLSEAEAGAIMARETREFLRDFNRCPHCAQALTGSPARSAKPAPAAPEYI